MTIHSSRARLIALGAIAAIQVMVIIGLAWSLHVDNQARLSDDILLRETALSLRQTSYYLNNVCTDRHAELFNERP